jgi:DNA-binding response OmpR family regulator
MSKILIVDNEPNILMTLEFLLAQHGHQVRVARSGEEALDSVTAERPDLIIMDIALPFRSGFEVCQIVRRRPEWKDVRIVLLSARGRHVDVAKGMAMGADAFFVKPFSTQEFVKRVRDLLS